MKKATKTIGLAAMMAVMIPLSAYAATTSGSSSANAPARAVHMDKAFPGKAGGFDKAGLAADQTVLDLLKLDQAGLKAKLAEGKTLAEIAEEQGVSRDALKQALIDANTARLDKAKQQFADNVDNLIDSKGGAFAGKGGMRGFAFTGDLSAAATALGMTQDDLKTALQSGKTLAALAQEKNVDVQTLIDAEKAAITAQIQQRVKDGKLTQDQADKQLEKVSDLAGKIVNGNLFQGGGRGHHGSSEDSSQTQTETQSN